MPSEPTDAHLDVEAQSSVVFHLLEPPDARTIAELRAAIVDVPAERIDAAISSLAKAGVLITTPTHGVIPSEALRRLDHLGLIAA